MKTPPKSSKTSKGGSLRRMGNECAPPLKDEEDEAYEEWMTELASNCQADLRPCPGCQQGGICDGPNRELSHGRTNE